MSRAQRPLYPSLAHPLRAGKVVRCLATGGTFCSRAILVLGLCCRLRYIARIVCLALSRSILQESIQHLLEVLDVSLHRFHLTLQLEVVLGLNALLI